MTRELGPVDYVVMELPTCATSLGRAVRANSRIWPQTCSSGVAVLLRR